MPAGHDSDPSVAEFTGFMLVLIVRADTRLFKALGVISVAKILTGIRLSEYGLCLDRHLGDDVHYGIAMWTPQFKLSVEPPETKLSCERIV